MAIFAKCCCCDLKTGNIVLGSLSLICALIVLGNSAYGIESQNYNPDNQVMHSACVDIVAGIISIGTSICLIVGAMKANRKLIAVYLVGVGINIFLSILKMPIIFMTFGFNLMLLGTCLIGVSISIFIWLFPWSLYQDLQNSSAGGTMSATGGQVDNPTQTQSYTAVPMSVTYPAQGYEHQPPPLYPQKY